MKQIKQFASAHESGITVFLMFAAGLIFFNQTRTGCLSITAFSIIEIILVCALGYALHLKMDKKADNLHIIMKLVMCILFAAACYIVSFLRNYGLGSVSSNNLIVFTVVLIAVWFMFIYIFADKKLLDSGQVIGLIIFTGILLRFIYILMNGITEMQNDIGKLQDGQGHLGYIYYLYSHGRLPDFNPTSRLQFYHPPLHHALSAIWLRINTGLGFSIERAGENIQLLTFAYSSCMLLTTDGILKKLKADVISRMWALGILAFFPYFVTQAGAVNNDTLVTFLMALSIYFALRWYDEPTLKNIIPLGLCIGGAMMTKLSGGFVAPAVAYLFLVKLIKDRKNILNYVKQFVLFGIVTVPLGLWFPIRSRLLYDVPLNFVPKFSERLAQYIGKYNTAGQRLFDFSLVQFKSPAIVWTNIEAGCDRNIFITMIKCAMFNEGNWFMKDTFKRELSRVILWFAILMFIVLLALFIYWLVKSELELEKRIFAAITYVIIYVLYIKFCFDYEFICTMNVRYVLIPIMLQVIGAALAFGQLRKKKAGLVTDVLCVLPIIFGLLSSALFMGYFLH